MSIHPSEHVLSKVPKELWGNIMDRLDVHDVMSLRQAGKTWASVGQPYLFKTFVLRPDRDDFGNFQFIIDSDALKSVRGIRLELGTMSVFYAVQNLAFAYLEEHNELRAVRPEHIPFNAFMASFEGKSTAELDHKAEEAMAEYAAWNVRWHEAQQDFTAAGPLQGLFEGIITLDRVEMAYKACPFENKLLMNAW